MPEILSKIQQRKAMRKAAKEIYRKAYMKAKAEELRKARARARKEIQAAAIAAAKKKYGLTKAEKRKKLMEKIGAFAERMSKLGEEMGDIGQSLTFDLDADIEDLMFTPVKIEKLREQKKKKRKK